MAWEKRNGQKRYYTRSLKRNGKVIRQYVGMGPQAERAALEDMTRRIEREDRSRTRKQLESKLRETQTPSQALIHEPAAAVPFVTSPTY